MDWAKPYFGLPAYAAHYPDPDGDHAYDHLFEDGLRRRLFCGEIGFYSWYYSVRSIGGVISIEAHEPMPRYTGSAVACTGATSQYDHKAYILEQSPPAYNLLALPPNDVYRGFFSPTWINDDGGWELLEDYNTSHRGREDYDRVAVGCDGTVTVSQYIAPIDPSKLPKLKAAIVGAISPAWIAPMLSAVSGIMGGGASAPIRRKKS
jgi:hypothetical protein